MVRLQPPRELTKSQSDERKFIPFFLAKIGGALLCILKLCLGRVRVDLVAKGEYRDWVINCLYVRCLNGNFASIVDCYTLEMRNLTALNAAARLY